MSLGEVDRNDTRMAVTVIRVVISGPGESKVISWLDHVWGTMQALFLQALFYFITLPGAILVKH